jgi:hypothetical protein
MRPQPKALNELEQELWSALLDFIRENDGVAVSQPGVFTIRFESRLPELADLLRRRGFDVSPAGTAERLMPTSTTVKQHGGITTGSVQNVVPTEVLAFELRLPIDDNREADLTAQRPLALRDRLVTAPTSTPHKRKAWAAAVAAR